MTSLTLFFKRDIHLYTLGHETFKFTKLWPEFLLKNTKISQQHKISRALFNPYFHYHFSQQPATGPYPPSAASSVSSIKRFCLRIHFHIKLPYPLNAPRCSLPFGALSGSPVVTRNISVFPCVTSLLTPYTLHLTPWIMTSMITSCRQLLDYNA